MDTITKSELEILLKLIENELSNLMEVKNRTNKNYWDSNINELVELSEKISKLNS